jgi:hypothetical protein
MPRLQFRVLKKGVPWGTAGESTSLNHIGRGGVDSAATPTPTSPGEPLWMAARRERRRAMNQANLAATTASNLLFAARHT